MSHVDVTSIVGEEAAVAQVEVFLDGHTFSVDAVGSAKKHPNDPSVHSVGEALALSRAFTQVAARLEAYALDTSAQHIKAEKDDKMMRQILSKLGIED